VVGATVILISIILEFYRTIYSSNMGLSVNDMDMINEIHKESAAPPSDGEAEGSLKIDGLFDVIFIQNIMDHLKLAYPVDNTRSSKISLYKKFIKEMGMLKDPKNLSKICDRELRMKLSALARSRDIPDKLLLKKDVIDTILSFKNSKVDVELLLFLLSVTGKRVTEFINGNWSVSEEGDLFIDRVSKKRGEEIPVLGYKVVLAGLGPDTITPSEFIVLFNKFKKMQLAYNGGRSRGSEGMRQSLNIYLGSGKLAPVLTSKDARPLYIQLIKNYHPEFKMVNSAKLISGLLHHSDTTTSIYYNDKFDVVEKLDGGAMKKMTRTQLMDVVRKAGLGKGVTVGFGKMNKTKLIALIQKNKLDFIAGP